MEQRYPGFDDLPLGPGEGDIERAAAAAAEAAAEGPRPGNPGARGPRRSLVVLGAVVGILALAGTAMALAVRKPARSDVAGIVGDAAATSATSPVTTTDAPTPTATSVAATTPATTVPTTTRTKPSPTTLASSSTSPSTAASAGDETSCENESHDTPADQAMAFSGMQKGAQQAFLAAQAAAKAAGVKFVLNSGYRSWAYQERVFQCWVKQLGSPQAARQYALPPGESAHVKGYAMDIAPQSAAAWLEASAGKFGLCRRYVDEPWHFEYQSYYKTQGCPALLPQP